MLVNILLCILGFRLVEKFCLNKNLSQKNVNFITSNIHAVTTFFVSTSYLLNFLSIETYLRLTFISISYAIYDNYLIIKEDTPGKFFLIIHHLMIIIVNLWVNYYRDEFVIEMMAYNYLTEITTPFLNLSLYLYRNKKTNIIVNGYNLFYSCNFILIITFFIFRILLGFYLVKMNLFYNYLSYFQVLMLGMNIYWFQKLVSKAIKVS